MQVDVSARVVPRPAHTHLRDEIQASQRGRLLVAMSDVVAGKGYGAASVADVLKAAGISRRTFYEQFADKEECFLAAYEYGVEAMLRAIGAALQTAGDWHESARAAIGTFLRLLGEEPGFARAFLVEVWAAGPAALERHAKVLENFHAVVRTIAEQARAADPSIAAATDVDVIAIVGGISRVATIEVLNGRAADLPALTDDLVEFASAVLTRTS